MSTNNTSLELTTQPRLYSENPPSGMTTSKFCTAIAGLYNIRTIHTDLNLARFRHDLRQTLRANPGADDLVSEDVIRALEVLGIANTFKAHFKDTVHRLCAEYASFKAGNIWYRVWGHYHTRLNATDSQNSDSDHGCRAHLLRTWTLGQSVYFLHYPQDAGDGDEDASSNTIGSCLCPVTAYLQCILLATPLSVWADYLNPATPNVNASPLEITKQWLDSKVGRKTADVVVLITLGGFIHRTMDYAAKLSAKAVEKKRKAEKKSGWLDGRRVSNLAKRLWRASTPPHDYGLVPEPARSEEPGLVAVEQAIHQLCRSGDQYAQLLRERDAAPERLRDSVEAIRLQVEYIVARAEPSVPHTILQLIPTLAKD